MAEPKISFGLPFYATQSEPGPKYHEGLCLADALPPRTKVTLVSPHRICFAKTLDNFHYQHPGGADFQATVLEGTEDCLRGADVAVIGASAGAVRLMSPSDVQVSVARDLESRARALLREWMTTGIKSDQRSTDVELNPLSNSPPQVVKVGEVTILTFEVNEGVRGFKLNGPIVIALHDRLFRLDGWCTAGDLVFAVNDRPYFAYTVQCCGCGASMLYVYDLSGAAPKQVYENGSLSD